VLIFLFMEGDLVDLVGIVLDPAIDGT
jgi:hypothetical protein